jgi:nucleoside 2-deoxyribosyltransferase
LNDNMVGYANISARDMLDHLFETYGNITAVDLEINFEHMRRAWDPQQPVETLFKQIQDCDDYSEAGGVLIGPSQQINVGYANIFATGNFMSACRRWNDKLTTEKTWTHFKSHFAAAHRQHKHMQGETAAHAGDHSANAAMTQNEDQMDEATIGALANLATATAADRGVVAALTKANSRLVKQLEDTNSELRELKAMFHQERRDKRGPRGFNASASNYCSTHGYKLGKTHTSLICNTRNPGHKAEATLTDNMGGSQANKE